MATNRSPKTSLLEKIEAHWKSVLIIAGVFGGGFLVGKTYQKNESNIELSKIKSDADERLFKPISIKLRLV